MELDELRCQWQRQPADTATLVDSAALAQLLSKTVPNAVVRMRRNARWELAFTVALLIVSSIWLFYTDSNVQRTMLVWLIIICLVSIVSYHRHMLRGITGLSSVSATMREHIAERVVEVRKIIELSYRSVLWVLVATMSMTLLFSVTRIFTTYTGRTLLVQLGWSVVGYGVAGLIGYFGVRFLARAVLQDLYGQHLDRLETILRELNAW